MVSMEFSIERGCGGIVFVGGDDAVFELRPIFSVDDIRITWKTDRRAPPDINGKGGLLMYFREYPTHTHAG
ncbi:hypothetical protein WM06_11655 [Burkholderia cepacia]|nr:hypothetical protein WM06_11655 [Burkholderia cepacia]